MLSKSILSVITLFLAVNSFAVCIKNKSDYPIYYEIINKNTGCPKPKVQFHSGTVFPHAEKCHAHDSSKGDDWKIFRLDYIKAFKVEKDGTQSLVCAKNVDGILNFLEVTFIVKKWWCLDQDDYDD